jgi:hypothetical protein
MRTAAWYLASNMSWDFGTFVSLLTLPMLVLLPLAAWAITVFVVAVRIRRLSWIAVRPRLERPGAEDLSQGMRLLLGRLAAALRAAGFEPIESVHAPGFSGFGAWTQVLYVNPATGERASFLNRGRAPNTGSLNLLLATEYPPHDPIITGLPGGSFSVDEDFTAMLADLILRHRDAVRQACAEWQLDASSGLLVGVAPAPEDAIRWLQQRATAVAEAEAKRFGYRIDRSGERYVAPWSLVIRVAGKRMLSRKRRPSAARGFDALPAASGRSAQTP